MYLLALCCKSMLQMSQMGKVIERSFLHSTRAAFNEIMNSDMYDS